MILWYSGCGNSRFVAEQLSKKLSDNNLIFIPEAARQGTPLEFKPDETLGIVFPVYSWSVPKLVSEFLRKAKFIGRPAYIFAACTCGDETGLTIKHLKKDLSKQGLTLDAFFSFQMPETYINLPGFKLDTPENAERKISATKESLEETVKLIQQRAKGNFDRLKGGSSFLKSNILKPLFYGLLWHVDTLRSTVSSRGAARHSFQGRQWHISPLCEFRVAALACPHLDADGRSGRLFCQPSRQK